MILGLDIGSSGCKCVAFTLDGEELCSEYREYTHVPGMANLDPFALKEAAFSVIRGCASKLEDRRAVSAISISSFGESFVALDDKGEPLGDIVMYYVDASSSLFSGVVERAGADRLIEITRVMPETMYSLAKMLPIIQERGKVWKFLQVMDYIAWSLSGETCTDYSLATRTLLFDLSKLAWSDEILDCAGIPKDALPTPVKSGSIVGSITPAAASELGLERSVSIVICAQDQIAGALGSGVLEEGDAVDGNGTVECITPLFTGLREPGFTLNNYVTIPYLTAGGYVTYAFNFTGGSLLKWYRAAFGSGLKGEAGGSFYEHMNRNCPPAPSELVVIPHFQGAGGTPEIVREARGIIYGLDLKSDAYGIYRALLEGLSFEMKYNLEKLHSFGIDPRRFFAAGGGAKSKQWLQIKADIWGCEVLPVLTEEAGAQGTAIMAAAALHGEDITAVAKRFVKYGAPVKPSGEHAETYEKKYELYKNLRSFSLGHWRK